MRNLVHMKARDGEGTEYVSMCRKKHKTKLDMSRWAFDKNDTYPHPTCDICEFDRGEYPYRLDSLIRSGLVLRGPQHKE